MATLSADNRLRNRVASIEGTVILVGAGHVDRAIRFTVLPEVLKPFLTMVRKGDSSVPVYPVVLNLDRGPDQEAWGAAKREAFLGARRDQPMPEPLPVAEKPQDGWSLEAEDVPVIEMGDVKNKTDKGFVCETCTVGFNTENALKIHKGRTKHD